MVLPALGGAGSLGRGRCSLERYQTAYEPSRPRLLLASGTCAAIEAAYKRKYGIELTCRSNMHFTSTRPLRAVYRLSPRPIRPQRRTAPTGLRGPPIWWELRDCALPDAAAAPYLTGTRDDGVEEGTPACGEMNDRSTQEQIDAFEFLQEHIPTAARDAPDRVAAWKALPDNLHKRDRKRARRWSRGVAGLELKDGSTWLVDVGADHRGDDRTKRRGW